MVNLKNQILSNTKNKEETLLSLAFSIGIGIGIRLLDLITNVYAYFRFM